MELVNERRWRDGMRMELKTSDKVKGKIDGCYKKNKKSFSQAIPKEKTTIFALKKSASRHFYFTLKHAAKFPQRNCKEIAMFP